MTTIRSLMTTAIVTFGLAAGCARAADQAAATDAKPKPYTLDHCVVSGDKLGGDMGPPVVKVYRGQEIKFCCKDCIKDFNKDPDKVLAKIQAEEAKGAPAMPDQAAAPAGHDHDHH